jgi:Flp pilus assembly protein TadG
MKKPMPRPLPARTEKGATMVILVFGLAIFVIGVIGLFSFEVTRNNSCRDELKSACEAAALAAASALASSNNLNPTNCHNDAVEAAQQTFVSNSILGTLLSDVQFSDNRTSTAAAIRRSDPKAGWANMYIEFLTSSGAQSAWNAADGRVVHIIGVFGEQPAFGKYCGIDKVAVISEAQAQVPQMDIVMCFDVSGSIDDQTRVTFVKRYWDGSKIKYDIPTTTAGTAANGNLYGLLMPSPLGTSVNIEQPQNLSVAGSHTNKLYFQPSIRKGPAGGDVGVMPGPGSGGPNDFTDMVANLDGKDVYTTFTYTDTATGMVYPFPNIGTLVEAARGNLEDATVFAASKADTALGGIVTPKTGYQKVYWKLAHDAAQPIGAAREAATRFFRMMNNNTDGQFGFISFSSAPVATTPGNTMPAIDPVSGSYEQLPKIRPPYPGQSMAPNTVSGIINNVIPKTLANGSTDIGDAVQEAVNELVNNGRPGSNKAIIVFTDGQPNAGPPWSGPANTANTKGIAIYTVGLAQNAAIIPGECDNLNDQAGKAVTFTDPITNVPSSYTPGSSGLADVAGHGGKFFLVTDRNDLNFVFENIARQLVQLTVK